MDELRNRVLALIEQSWQTQRSGPLPAISDDDNLFDIGVVDSLLMMEIVVVVEDCCQVMIDFMSIDPEVFFTLGGILTASQELMAGSQR